MDGTLTDQCIRSGHGDEDVVILVTDDNNGWSHRVIGHPLITNQSSYHQDTSQRAFLTFLLISDALFMSLWCTRFYAKLAASLHENSSKIPNTSKSSFTLCHFLADLM